MQNININANIVSLSNPITADIVTAAIQRLNIVFNSVAFSNSLQAKSFVATNNPALSLNGKTITGKDVYDNIFSKPQVEIDIIVRKLNNPYKRYVSKTMGETNPLGNTIITYTWWLKNLSKGDLVKNYAVHLGHEIFHTNYFGYLHDPAIGTRDFDNDKDVTYAIDDILESLL